MPDYRLYFFGPNEHIVKAEVVNCTTDEAAIATARAKCTEHPAIEVWERARRVERVGVTSFTAAKTEANCQRPTDACHNSWQGAANSKQSTPDGSRTVS